MFKRRYQYHLLRNFIDCIDNHQEFKPHVLTSLTIVKKAWGEISVSTITNCFKHCYCTHSVDAKNSTLTDSVIESKITEDLQGLFECETPMEDVMEEYVLVDDKLEVAEMLCDAEIASMVTGKVSGVIDDEQVDECDEEILKPTKPQLKSAIQLIQSHLLRSNNGNQNENQQTGKSQ